MNCNLVHIATFKDRNIYKIEHCSKKETLSTSQNSYSEIEKELNKTRKQERSKVIVRDNIKHISEAKHGEINF
jgi:hypothetical protein